MNFTVRDCSEVIKWAVDFETPFAVFSMPISENSRAELEVVFGRASIVPKLLAFTKNYYQPFWIG